MSTTEIEPFRQGRFEDLPDAPRRPHVYFRTRAEELDMESLPFGRLRVHFRVHGEGPPLLLVHGLMTTSYSWRYVLPELGRRYTLYVPDLPGAGRSGKPLEPSYHPDAMADWIGEFQRAVGIRGCLAIGNSMGGYLCMRLALRDPGAMSRLVNVHSPGVPEPRLLALRVAFAIPGSRRLLLALVHRDPLRWAHRNVHYWDESLKSLEEAREYGGALADRTGCLAFGKFLSETLAAGPMKTFHRELLARRRDGLAFPIPLLLLYARRDPMVPARFGDVFAERIPSARLVRIDEASHFAHVDGVERFLPPVLEFLTAS